MKVEIIKLHSEITDSKPVCACIGYFDGLHRGHKGLIDAAIEKAKEYNCESALITFDPDPWITIGRAKSVKHLTSMAQRIELAEKMGLDRVIILDFIREMADLPPQEFTDMLLTHCNLKALVCGFDFHYGKFGAGNTETLKKEAEGRFDAVVIDSINDQGDKISSSRICNCLAEGNISEANRLLGYPYEIIGTVVHGRQKGRLWGVPTANIQYDEETLLPLGGVYAGVAEYEGKKKMAMINVGYNPTCNPINTLSVEAHILDCNEDLYDKTMRIRFYERLRSEQKFDSLDQLVDQLNRDRESVRQYFKVFDHE